MSGYVYRGVDRGTGASPHGPVILHPLGLTPEEIGLLVRAEALPECGAVKDTGGRRWVCRTTVHDTLPGVGYGRAESHRWVPVPL